jgi:hypothetical protein
MTVRKAACSCGQLRVSCTGEPVRISVCHCFACQQRTGSVFGTQARYSTNNVTIEGRSTQYSRTGDSGTTAIFHFCPVCGTTLYWRFAANPDVIAIAVGTFTDPRFPKPRVSVYEVRRHPWVHIEDDPALQHED